MYVSITLTGGTKKVHNVPQHVGTGMNLAEDTSSSCCGREKEEFMPYAGDTWHSGSSARS